jgi:hypothetical protein
MDRIQFQANLNRTTILCWAVFVPGRFDPGGLGLIPGQSKTNERGLSCLELYHRYKRVWHHYYLSSIVFFKLHGITLDAQLQILRFTKLP